MTQEIPNRLGCRKLVDGQADGQLTRLTEDDNRARVIRAPLRPVRALGGSCRADSGGVRMTGSWWRRSKLGAINVAPKIESTKDHANGGGPGLVVLPIEDDICLLKKETEVGVDAIEPS